MVEIESAGAPIHDPSVTLLYYGADGCTYLDFQTPKGMSAANPMERGQRRVFFLPKAVVAERFGRMESRPPKLRDLPIRAWRIEVRGSGRMLHRRRPWAFHKRLKWVDWSMPSAFAFGSPA